MEQNLSRRAFLGLGASAAVAASAMGLAGCSQPQSATPAPQTGTDAAPAAGGAPADFVPNFMTAPAEPESVAETKDCDVLVIGLGLSGCAAAKAAAEEGAKVIAVEKSPELAAVSMAGDFGVVGSQIQKDLGIKWAGTDVIVNQLMLPPHPRLPRLLVRPLRRGLRLVRRGRRLRGAEEHGRQPGD